MKRHAGLKKNETSNDVTVKKNTLNKIILTNKNLKQKIQRKEITKEAGIDSEKEWTVWKKVENAADRRAY